MPYHYQYLFKKDQCMQDAYQEVIYILHKVQRLLPFTFDIQTVGSCEWNLITYDPQSNVGFDFDFNLEVNDPDEEFSAKEIKQKIMNALNEVARQYGYDYCEDSTRVITIKVKDRENSRILHSCDFCIVNTYEDEDGHTQQQYIHYDKKQGKYTWQNQPQKSCVLFDKVEWIKDNKLWDEVRGVYLNKKNNNTNANKHSYSLRAEAIHQVCQQNGYYNYGCDDDDYYYMMMDDDDDD